MKKIFITTAALLIACTLSAADLFVSPEGNDRNPGTKDSPKATLTAALRQARELRRLNDESVKGGITIHLEAGDYHLYDPSLSVRRTAGRQLHLPSSLRMEMPF